MATTLADDDLLTVRLNFSSNGRTDRMLNVLHYQIRGLVGAPPNLVTGLSEIATAVFDHLDGPWADFASSATVFENVSVTNVFPLPRSVTITAAPGPGVPGDVLSDPIPTQDAPTILKRTDFGARWGLGRIFVTGTPESGQDAGILTGGQLALLNALATQLEEAVVVVGTGFTCSLDLCLLRGPEDNPISITKVLRCEASDAVLKTQRRRRPGKGG